MASQPWYAEHVIVDLWKLMLSPDDHKRFEMFWLSLSALCISRHAELFGPEPYSALWAYGLREAKLHG